MPLFLEDLLEGCLQGLVWRKRIGVHLYCNIGKEGCVHHKSERATGAREVEHRGSLECMKKGIEDGLLLDSPKPGLVSSS